MKQIVKDFIVKEFMLDDPNASVENDQPLMQEGIIDSLGIFTLIAFIEQQFRVKVQPEDVVLENFESVNKINSLIVSKMTQQASA
jgi:acyl carrier protein